MCTHPFFVHCIRRFLTRHTRVPSPVVPVPGVGQVGQGLQNTWGLDDEDDDEVSDEEEEKKVTRMEEEPNKNKAQSTEGFTLLFKKLYFFILNLPGSSFLSKRQKSNKTQNDNLR